MQLTEAQKNRVREHLKRRLLAKNSALGLYKQLEDTNSILSRMTTEKQVYLPEGVGYLKGDKGDKGDTPQRGIDYFTEADIEMFKQMATPTFGVDYFTDEQIVEMIAQATPSVGVDYFTDEDKKKMVREVRQLIREPKDGYTPVKGVDYFDGKDGSPDTPEQIVGKINSLTGVIEPSAIKDMITLESVLKEIKAKKLLQLKDIKDAPLNFKNTGLHGGGPKVSVDGTYVQSRFSNFNLIGGSNVTITVVENVNEERVDITIDSSGGGSGSFVYGENLTPQGPGTVFTLASIPTAGTVRLYRGGARQLAGVSADYTVSGATITLNDALVAGEILQADYNT